MTPGDTIDINSAAFARRLANLLAERRRESGKSLRSLARLSKGSFSVRDLRELEQGNRALDDSIIGAAALLYQADLDSILPARLPLEIRPFGVLATSGLTTPFVPDDSTSLLSSYLRLVRQLRLQQREPSIELRREDIEVIAEFLGESPVAVIDRLGALMGATQSQRRAMAGMFLAGAVVIGLAGGSVAALGARGSSSDSSDTTPVQQAATTTLVVAQDASTLPSAPITTQASTPTPSTTPSTLPTTTPSTLPTTLPTTTTITVTTAVPPATTQAPVANTPSAPVVAPVAAPPTTATTPTTPIAGNVIFGGPEAPTQAEPIIATTSDPAAVADGSPPVAPVIVADAPPPTPAATPAPPTSAVDVGGVGGVGGVATGQPPVPSLP